MLEMKADVTIDAPLAVTWRYLSDLERISDWSDAIEYAYCTSTDVSNSNTVRTCKLTNGLSINESITDWQEKSSFSYESYDIPMVKKASNTWRVTEFNGQTLVSSESTVIMKGGGVGRLLEPLMRWMSKRMCISSLASFKHQVETGKPFSGPPSQLNTAGVSC